MAPAIVATLLTSTLRHLGTVERDVSALGPLAARSILLARDDDPNGKGKEVDAEPGGVIDPHKINNKALFALFGLIGVAFVVTGIWFFFWAKNGGFYFRENDWEEYKSTVLRRKGPNGTTLSGATESTDLGGGSVYKDVDDGTTEDCNTTVVSGSTNLTGITGGVSDFSGREKRRKKREQKEREKEHRREEKAREREHRKRARKVGADGVLVDEEAEAEPKQHLRSYRHEKPARVGGINKESEGSTWDGSTNPSHSNVSGSGYGSGYGTSTAGGDGSDMYSAAGEESTVMSELISNRERTPTSTPTKKQGGIRKVYSTADKNASREAERVRAEARRLQERGRAVAAAGPSSSSRRNFSWQRADDSNGLRAIEEGSSVSGTSGNDSHVPGGWVGSEVGTGTASESGTKIYQHSVHIPGTATSDFAYAEEKRNKRRNGASNRRGA